MAVPAYFQKKRYSFKPIHISKFSIHKYIEESAILLSDFSCCLTSIQGVSEIGGQILRAYFTCCKDEKRSYKHGSGNASFTSYKHFKIILQKWAGIHYMYGRANGNCRKAQLFYQEIFPQKRCPSKNTFSSLHRRLRETGYFLPNTVNRG